MTATDIAVLMDLAAQTVIPMGLSVTVTTKDGMIALQYGNTVTTDSERAFMDFQTYSRQVEFEQSLDDAEFEHAGLQAVEEARNQIGTSEPEDPYVW